MESGTCCSRPSLTHYTFCTVAFTVFFGRVIVCCALVQAKYSHIVCFHFPHLFDHGHSGRSRDMRITDEAKLWFVDFHAYQARVHGKSLAHNIRRAKQLVSELFGPLSSDTFRRWHDGGAPNADLGGRPPAELTPFALPRLAHFTLAVAARLSLSVSTWQHVYRRVLRELDIEFEPARHSTRQFRRSLQLS